MKKNFARIIALIVAVMMVAALFAGCKSDKKDDNDKDNKEAATNAEGNNGGSNEGGSGDQTSTQQPNQTTQQPEQTTQQPEQPPVNQDALEDGNHDCWVALGQHQLADGTVNGWGDKDSELFRKSSLRAISLEDLKAIDGNLYNVFAAKSVKYLYTIDLIFGVNDAGWTCNCIKDGMIQKANGSCAFKIGQCSYISEDDVYSVDQWISDPHTAYAESLTPDTLFMPAWQEDADANGFTWADNPVVIGGAGLYTLVIAQYDNAAYGQPGYGIALVLKEARNGFGYETVSAAGLSGTYRVIKVNGESVTDYFTELAESYGMSLEEFCDASGISTEELDSFMTITFNADGDAVVTNAVSHQTFNLTVTYDGNTFTATDEDGVTKTGTVINDTFDLDFEGTVLTFGK